MEVLYTISNKIGGGTQVGQYLLLKDQLYSYAKEAFGVSEERHQQLLTIAAEEKV